jgi:hypothetical protein
VIHRAVGGDDDLAARQEYAQLRVDRTRRLAPAFGVPQDEPGEHTFRASIGRARDALDRGFSADDPPWIRFVDHSEISTQEAVGVGHSNLGNYRTAIELYGMSLAAPDVAVRNRTCSHARLAAALAAEGDRSTALSEAGAVLAVLADGVKSTRALNELRPVRDVARQVNDEEFRVRFDSVESALTA